MAENTGGTAGGVADTPGAIKFYNASLETLRALFESHFRRELYQGRHPELRDDLFDELREQYATMWQVGATTNGSTKLKNRMHHHPRTFIKCSNELRALANYAENTSQDAVGSQTSFAGLQTLLSYWHAANSFKLLHRFLDDRQPRSIEVPHRIGADFRSSLRSNPNTSSSLAEEWALRRNFIKLLHFPGLVEPALNVQGGYEYRRFHAFIYAYGFGRGLLETELDRVGHNGNNSTPVNEDGSTPNDNDNDDDEDDYRTRLMDLNAGDIEWIRISRRVIRNILENVAEIAYNPLPAGLVLGGRNVPQEPPMTRAEQVRFNIQFHNVALANIMFQRMATLLEAHPFERLLLDLLARENAFEQALTEEHIEDKLINKQISILDELPLSNPAYLTMLYHPSSKWESPLDKENFLAAERFVYKILGDIALLNRQRYTFRLTRDWNFGRPWNQIYQLYDSTKLGNDWQRDAILEFNQKTVLTNMYQQGQYIYDSSYYRLVRKLFGFLPIDMGDVNQSVRFQTSCQICKENFEGDAGLQSTVFALPCSKQHIFHTNCLIEYWDEPGRYLQRCPICREFPELNWRRMGLDTTEQDFVHNVFDWKLAENAGLNDSRRDRHDARNRTDLYDVPETQDPRPAAQAYHRFENEYAAAVGEHQVLPWYPMTFQPGQLTKVPEFRGSAASELASRITQQYMDRRFPLPHMAVERANAMDITVERVLHRPRFEPVMEAAFLRSMRRRRNKERRMRVAQERRGLNILA